MIGAVALAAATLALEHIGFDRIAAHEAELTRYALAHLPRVPGLRIYGPRSVSSATPKIGVVPFAIEGLHHDLVATVLSYEHGVGVRSGCFCAHPYVAHLLGMSSAQARRTFDQAAERRQA